MSNLKQTIKTPVGRIVMGDLYKANTTDAEGKPLTVKNGPNTGQPTVAYFFALAIPKGPEPHWAHTVWGNVIWNIGNQAFPDAAKAADFAWKVVDGDSPTPGKLFKGKPGKAPRENEGWAGNWVIKFKSTFAPKVYQIVNGQAEPVLTEGFCKAGYYAEVLFDVDSNQSSMNPGVFVNAKMVCFRGFGPEITSGPDVNEVGFGAAPLPAGVSTIPLASGVPLPSTTTGIPSPMGLPASPLQPATLPAASVPVIPQPQFLQMPAAALPTGQFPAPAAAALPTSIALPASPSSVPAPPLPPAPPAGPTMTAKAGGASYETFIQAGWTPATMIAQGYMTA
jgi:hypothetical protein